MKTNEVLETIKARRSVRVYDKKQVPSEDRLECHTGGSYLCTERHAL